MADIATAYFAHGDRRDTGKSFHEKYNIVMGSLVVETLSHPPVKKVIVRFINKKGKLAT